MNENVVFVNVADLRDPGDPEGRSYRQVNNAKQHAIPLGSLVELKDGVRLFVMMHQRDCDGTPLYGLGPDLDAIGCDKDDWQRYKWDNGHGEESLTVIREPK